MESYYDPLIHTVDERNPAPVYLIIYKVLHIPGGDRRISEPSTNIFPPCSY